MSVWWVSGLSVGILTTARTIRRLQVRRRVNRMVERMKAGRCPSCNKDLRLSKERCPACGWEFPFVYTFYHDVMKHDSPKS